MEKLLTPAMVGTALLIATAIGMVPPALANHDEGHTSVGAGPLLIELTRLEPRIPVTVNNAPEVNTPSEKLGQIGAITVTIEDVQGADNTTFTTAGFGFGTACDIVKTLPLVRQCTVVPGTAQNVHAPDPSVSSSTVQKCIYGLRLSVSVGPFQPFVATGELLTPVDGPCPA